MQPPISQNTKATYGEIDTSTERPVLFLAFMKLQDTNSVNTVEELNQIQATCVACHTVKRFCMPYFIVVSAQARFLVLICCQKESIVVEASHLILKMKDNSSFMFTIEERLFAMISVAYVSFKELRLKASGVRSGRGKKKYGGRGVKGFCSDACTDSIA